MIETKKDLDNYIIADYVMNRGYTHPSFIVWIKQILFPDYLMQYLVSMRKFSFYSKKCGLRNKILSLYYQRKFLRLGLKLGYSIDPYVLGYGCVIPHHGTIVVGGGNIVGNFAVLHTSTCITHGNKNIGDGLYLSTGSQIVGDVKLGDNTSIASHSLVNKAFAGNTLLAGSPASVIKEDYKSWYERDGEKYENRVSYVKTLFHF